MNELRLVASTTKDCFKCGEEKSLSEFYRNKKGKGGLHSWCKSCVRTKVAEWQARNPEYRAAAAREWRKRNPASGKASYRGRSVESILLVSAKARAKKLGLEFNLEIGDIAIPEFCPILKTLRIERGSGKPQNSSPTLDRVNLERGYVKGNVCVISHRANRIKSDGTAEQHRAIAEYMEQAAVEAAPLAA